LWADGDVGSTAGVHLRRPVLGPIMHQGCLFSEAAGVTLTVMGWYIVLAVALILPYVLAHFDYTHLDVIGGLLVLSLYVGVVVTLAVLLMRFGRRLRAK
jgi:hypothetical protein